METRPSLFKEQIINQSLIWHFFSQVFFLVTEIRWVKHKWLSNCVQNTAVCLNSRLASKGPGSCAGFGTDSCCAWAQRLCSCTGLECGLVGPAGCQNCLCTEFPWVSLFGHEYFQWILCALGLVWVQQSWHVPGCAEPLRHLTVLKECNTVRTRPFVTSVTCVTTLPFCFPCTGKLFGYCSQQVKFSPCHGNWWMCLCVYKMLSLVLLFCGKMLDSVLTWEVERYQLV